MNLGFIQSLFFFFGVFSLIYGVAFRFYPGHKDRQAIFHWSQASLIWGCCIVLTVFRKEIPLFFSYYLANAMAFLAYVEFNRALKALLVAEAFQPPKRWLDALMLLAHLGILYAIGHWTPADYSATAQTVFVSLLVFVVSLLGASYCFQIHRAHHLKMAWYFAYFHLVFGVLWLLRAISAVLFQAASAFDPGPVNTLIWMCLFIMGVIKYIVFPMLLQQKSENDRLALIRSSLVKANKTVATGALSASIAHELNQPLTTIRLNGQLLRQILQNQELSNDEAKTIVEEILGENERAAKIISSLRAIFSGNAAAQSEIDATPLIRKSLGLLAREIEKHHIRLDLQLEEDLRVAIPEDELYQVLLNLLLNSIEALQDPSMARERVITVEAKRHGSEAQICISDTGLGVKSGMEAVLFEILSTSKNSGMGVGLWLCKYIVERHAGEIAYTPSASGGAAFIITLPICPEPAVEGAKQA
jgi:signal transduction histidine kinase